MIITTQNGDSFVCKSVVLDRLSKYLFIHITDTDIIHVVSIFHDDSYLPLQEYPAFKYFDSFSFTSTGDITIRLRQAKERAL